MRRHWSPTTVIALLALFFALGGTAIAAKHYLITSAGQIKPSVLRALHGATGPAGPTGAAGATGATGPVGPQGPAGPVNLSTLTIVTAPKQKLSNDEAGNSVATCPAGSHVVSGGQYVGFATYIFSGISEDHQSWIVLVYNESGIMTNLEAVAYCAGAGQAVAASMPSASHARAVREANALMAKLMAERAAIKR